MLALLGLTSAMASCPTVKTVGSQHFNLTEWVRKTWYIQEQQIVDYQPLDSFYCVAATYNLPAMTRHSDARAHRPRRDTSTYRQSTSTPSAAACTRHLA